MNRGAGGVAALNKLSPRPAGSSASTVCAPWVGPWSQRTTKSGSIGSLFARRPRSSGGFGQTLRRHVHLPPWGEPPTPHAPAVGKANGKAAGKVQKVGSGADPTGASRPDVGELVRRAEALLAQLAEIEDRLEVAQEDSGLSGKAKASDLTAKRDTVLRMLGALEKAKRAL